MHAYYERHTCEMAPVRNTPMIWPMRDARLWDDLCEKRAYEMVACERHAYGMEYGRCTPIKYPSIGDILIPRRCL
jgi:hypothetical protein